MNNIFASIHGLCNRVKRIILENKTVTENGLYGPKDGCDGIGSLVVDVKPKNKAVTISSNGLYSAIPKIATESFNESTSDFDIPVILKDGTVVNFQKSHKISSVIPAGLDEGDCFIDFRIIHSGGTLSNSFPLKGAFFTSYTETGSLGTLSCYKLGELTHLDVALAIMYVNNSDDAIDEFNEHFADKFENGYVYFSDILTTRLEQQGFTDITWTITISGPGFEKADGALPITVDVPTGMYIVEFPKTEYIVGEEIDLTGGVLKVFSGEGYNVNMTRSDIQIRGFDTETPGTKVVEVGLPESAANGEHLYASYLITVKEA